MLSSATDRGVIPAATVGESPRTSHFIANRPALQTLRFAVAPVVTAPKTSQSACSEVEVAR